jgi:hypothetical protein
MFIHMAYFEMSRNLPEGTEGKQEQLISVLTLETRTLCQKPTITATTVQTGKGKIFPVVTICTTCYNTLKLCILPTQCICVFRVVLTINTDCFPKQH